MDREQYNRSFDDWFREAEIRQPEPPFNEAAWLMMEALLKREEKKRRRFFAWWWFAGLLILGYLMLYSLKPGSHQMAVDHQNTQPDVFLPYQGSEAASPEKTRQLPLIPGRDVAAARQLPRAEQPSGNFPIQSTVVTEPGLSPFTSVPYNGKQKVSVTEKPETTIAGVPASNAGQVSPGTVKTVVPAAAVSRKGKSSNAKYTPESTSLAANSDRSTYAVSGGKKQPAESAISRAAENVAATPTARDMSEIKTSLRMKATAPDCIDPVDGEYSPPVVSIKPEISKKSHFYVYAAGLPEWSFVPGNKLGELNIGYTGGIGYRIAKRWYVQAGVAFNKKKYEADADDYTPKPGSYFTNPNYKLQEVYADCSIIEIPLQFRYDISQQKKYSLFVTASLASTIMKREGYDYDYLRYGNQADGAYTYRTNSFKLFSGASVGFGYERPLFKQFSIHAVPYFSIPLRGVGEGSVKLGSIGIQTGVRYNLPF